VTSYSGTPGNLEAAATQPLQHQDKLTISRSVYPESALLTDCRTHEPLLQLSTLIK